MRPLNSGSCAAGMSFSSCDSLLISALDVSGPHDELVTREGVIMLAINHLRFEYTASSGRTK